MNNHWIETNKVSQGRYEITVRGEVNLTVPVQSRGRNCYAVELPNARTHYGASLTAARKIVETEVRLIQQSS